MRMLSKHEADQLLVGLNLKIGNWNELTNVDSDAVLSKAFRPSRGAVELYEEARRMLGWIACGGWTLLQIDNSTAPTDEEIAVLEKLVLPAGAQWDVAEQKSFLFDGISEASSATDQTGLVLIVFFSLLFEWHVYLTSEHAASGQRLALQDGVVYFFGESEAIDTAKVVVSDR